MPHTHTHTHLLKKVGGPLKIVNLGAHEAGIVKVFQNVRVCQRRSRRVCADNVVLHSPVVSDVVVGSAQTLIHYDRMHSREVVCAAIDAAKGVKDAQKRRYRPDVVPDKGSNVHDASCKRSSDITRTGKL